MPERDVGTAVYGEGHSRPAQQHSRPSTAAGENAPRQDIPLDWVQGVCPTRVPVGSPRKSAAIIPFVNKTLTSGLPIGSGRKWLRISARWLSHYSVPGGDMGIGSRRPVALTAAGHKS
jgi:hypothetical protein